MLMMEAVLLVAMLELNRRSTPFSQTPVSKDGSHIRTAFDSAMEVARSAPQGGSTSQTSNDGCGIDGVFRLPPLNAAVRLPSLVLSVSFWRPFLIIPNFSAVPHRLPVSLSHSGLGLGLPFSWSSTPPRRSPGSPPQALMLARHRYYYYSPYQRTAVRASMYAVEP